MGSGALQPRRPAHTPAARPPQTTGAFWQTWKDFEVRHGNEDTIREMLRIRRSVQATYNTQVNFMASQMLKVSGSATGTGEQPRLPLSLARPHQPGLCPLRGLDLLGWELWGSPPPSPLAPGSSLRAASSAWGTQ